MFMVEPGLKELCFVFRVKHFLVSFQGSFSRLVYLEAPPGYVETKPVFMTENTAMRKYISCLLITCSLLHRDFNLRTLWVK